MENNFLGEVKTTQIVTVFNDYSFYLDDLEEKSLGSYYDVVASEMASQARFSNNWILGEDKDKMNKYIEEITIGKQQLNTVIAPNSTTLEEMNKYNLQDATSLYTELAKIQPFNSKEIIKFSKVFGLPYGVNANKGIAIVISDQLKISAANYINLNRELAWYRYIFDLFQGIVTKNMDNLRKKRKEKSKLLWNSLEERSEEIIEITGETPQYWNRILEEISEDKVFNNESQVLITGKQTLESLLKRNGGVKIDVTLDMEQNAFYPTAYFSNLFKYAYFQIMKALVNDVELRDCEYCGHVFEVTYDGRRFCPPLPFRKRSSCEMAYNNRRRKQNKERNE